MIRRYLRKNLLLSLQHFPAVLVLGARQVGKSTLVEAIGKEDWKARYISLDNRTTLDLALTQPDALLAEMGSPLIIDEVQRAPDLMRALKVVIDREKHKGMYILTGSANILTLTKVSETLAGRIAVHELLPFSWAEMNGKEATSIIDQLFSAESAKEFIAQLPHQVPSERLDEIKEIILRGSFPVPAFLSEEKARYTWFDSYLQTYVERDLRDIATLEHLPDFRRLIQSLALHTGQLLNKSEVSRDVGLKLTTLRRYFHILMETFHVYLIHPYFVNIDKRFVKTPKVYFSDTGLVCHLSDAEKWETLTRQSREGALAETWAANELRKLLSLSSARTTLWFWRTEGGEEIDFVLERGGSISAIEVKWGSSVREGDLSALRECRKSLKERFKMGIVLYNGREIIAAEDRIVLIPFSLFFGRDP